MKETLDKCTNITQYSSINYDISQQQMALEDENKAIQGELADSYIQEAITEINTLV